MRCTLFILYNQVRTNFSVIFLKLRYFRPDIIFQRTSVVSSFASDRSEVETTLAYKRARACERSRGLIFRSSNSSEREILFKKNKLYPPRIRTAVPILVRATFTFSCEVCDCMHVLSRNIHYFLLHSYI